MSSEEKTPNGVNMTETQTTIDKTADNKENLAENIIKSDIINIESDISNTEIPKEESTKLQMEVETEAVSEAVNCIAEVIAKADLISKMADDTSDMSDTSSVNSDSAGSGNGKDSGCEVTLPEVSKTEVVLEAPFAPPTDELADRIVQQVEFYFSDVNIQKDAFLLKHVKRNKEGYVSLKLISSFKRVKHLTKDWRVVAYALKRSDKLEINELGTKLRRLAPLPQYDETTPSRTVIAVSVDTATPKVTIENVAELFSSCGEISLVRILRVGNPVPSDVRHIMNKNPTWLGKTCALIEFVNSESARNAVNMPKSNENFQVYEINCIPHPERKKKPKNMKNQQKHPQNCQSKKYDSCGGTSATSEYYSSSCHSSSETDERIIRHVNGNQLSSNYFDHQRLRMRRGSSTATNYAPNNAKHNTDSTISWLQRRLSASATEANFMSCHLPVMSRRLSYGSRDSQMSMSSDCSSTYFIPRRVSTSSIGSDCEPIREGHAFIGGGAYGNPPMATMGGYGAMPNLNRRMSACSISSDGSGMAMGMCGGACRARSNSNGEMLIRLPKGPDGSRGFGFRKRVSLETIHS
jgi:la-related protein 6